MAPRVEPGQFPQSLSAREPRDLRGGSTPSLPLQAAVHVKYSKSDLSTTQGAHQVYSRIEAAANTACNTSRTDIDFIMRGASPCVRRAIARVVNATKSSILAQVCIDENGAYA